MFLSAVLILLLFVVLTRRSTPGLKRPDLPLAYGLRLAGDVIFLLIYTYYYGWGDLTADPAAFMKESKMLTDVFYHSPKDYFTFLFGLEDQDMVYHYLKQTFHWNAGNLTLINDSKNVIRINSLLNFFTQGNVFFNSAIVSFFSLLGFRELYKTLKPRISVGARILWYCLILFPSTLFWTSGMLKEPFMMIGFCLLIAAIFGKHTTTGRTWRYLLSFLLFVAFKPYVLVCLIPVLLVKWLFRPQKRSYGFSMLYFVLPLLLFGIVLAIPSSGKKVTSYLTRKQYDFINVGRGGLHAYADTCFFYFRPDQYSLLHFGKNDEVYLKHPVMAKRLETGKASPFYDVYLQPNSKPWHRYYMAAGSQSYIAIPELLNKRKRLITTAPHALVNASFRPFFGDEGSWLKIPAIIETIALFAFLAYAFVYSGTNRKKNAEIILFLLAFSIVLLLLIGWITPVLGAIARYRIPAYLSLFIISLLLYRKRKFV